MNPGSASKGGELLAGREGEQKAGGFTRQAHWGYLVVLLNARTTALK